MVSFYIYDIALLILFSIFVFWFIKSRRNKVQREGIMFMYRTQIGVRAINWFSNKFQKILHPLKYLVVVLGFVLMGGMIWMLWQSVSVYISVPEIVEVVKAPPIAPLIPYFPEIFGLTSFFPKFYFIYFIVALAIVAIVHEFSHGIYMKLFRIKIKSTGVAFLGPFLGAFVEEEKTNFEKKKNLEQMTVLGAGVFANILTALIFIILILVVYNFGFSPQGYAFNTYPFKAITLNEVDSYGENSIMQVLFLGDLQPLNLTLVSANGTSFFIKTSDTSGEKNKSIIAFYDTPAIREGLYGGIVEIDGVKISNSESLGYFLSTKSPGEEVDITFDVRGETFTKKVTLGSSPENSSKAFLGLSYLSRSTNSNLSSFEKIQMFIGNNYLKFREPNARETDYYSPSSNKAVTFFIYDFLWWVILINILVALFNMLPVGILDGGRFFYLGVLSITRSEKVARVAYKVATYAILLAFVLMMVIYLLRVF
ncbi:MAG: site-2 protease family protein [Candidatus Pacearchaeota archaeon]